MQLSIWNTPGTACVIFSASFRRLPLHVVAASVTVPLATDKDTPNGAIATLMCSTALIIGDHDIEPSMRVHVREFLHVPLTVTVFRFRTSPRRGGKPRHCKAAQLSTSGTDWSRENLFGAPRKIVPTGRAPQDCRRMIPLCSRFDSSTFTPGLSAIGNEINFSRCPSIISSAMRAASWACRRGSPLSG
jgi:hypothetical protein